VNAKILRAMLSKLVQAHGHEPTCSFHACNCGAVAKQRAVLIEANKLLRKTTEEGHEHRRD